MRVFTKSRAATVKGFYLKSAGGVDASQGLAGVSIEPGTSPDEALAAEIPAGAGLGRPDRRTLRIVP